MKGNCIARALYDNVRESPDELAFRKGDLLTVLEQNTAGLEGWWLCSLRGMQGICPGNRLRIIPGCYDTGTGLTTLSAVQSATTGQSSTSGYQRTQANKVVTPRRVGDIFAYDTPRPQHNQRLTEGTLASNTSELLRSNSVRCPPSRMNIRSSLEQYDTPRSALECQYDSPTSRPLYDSPRTSQTVYNSPKPLNENADKEPSSNGSCSLIKGIRGISLPSANRPVTNQNKNNSSYQQEYDIPRPLATAEVPSDQQTTDRSSRISMMSCDSSSSVSSLQASESLSLSSVGDGSSNRSSLDSHDLYDVPPEPRKFLLHQLPKLPPREKKDIEATSHLNFGEKSVSKLSEEVVYDVPPQVCRDGASSHNVDSLTNRLSSGSDSSCLDIELLDTKELPLELDSAKDTLAKLEQDVLSASERFSSLLKNSKLVKQNPEEIKLAIFKLKESLREFLNFGRGSSANAFKSGEGKLSKKIFKLIDPLENSQTVIEEAWKKLQITPLSTPTAAIVAQEQSSQVASITNTLCENIRLLHNLLHTHAESIFKRSPTLENSKKDEEKTPVQERPLPAIPTERPNKNEAWLEDYDYVNLESRERLEMEHKQMLEILPNQLRKSYDNLFRQSHLTVDNDHKKAISDKPLKTELDSNDKQILEFYGSQAKLHLQNLNSAIDAFLLTIENNQPPKVFIAHSKFVILSAHKLVFIGDTVHRNVLAVEVRTLVLNCSNALCDAMKKTVADAKTAAMQFPSVTAVQTMVDSFVAVSHLANSLKRAICRE